MPVSSNDAIAEKYAERLKASHPAIEMMRQIADLSNGNMPVPLPEMDEAQKPAVANLVAEAIDQTSMRVASTSPNYLVPPGNPRNERSKARAEVQRMAMIAYAQENQMKKVRRRRARFLSAYGQSGVILRPDFKRHIPVWQVRDPFHTFPSPSEFYDDEAPMDCIFGFRKPLGWLRRNYPVQYEQLRKGPKDSYTDDTMFELVEYVDEYCIKLLGIGVKEDFRWAGLSMGDEYLGERVVELENIPNRAGICTVVAPTRITLDQVQGQFNQLIGMYEAQARLVALDLIAVERGIFPDIALVGANGQTPTLVNGEWMDGRSGGINIVRNGDVKVINQSPGQSTNMAADRLERAQRMSGSIPSQWQGENPTNIRTGRASEVTMSATVDFRIQEYQETLALSEQAEFCRAVKIAKGYFGDVPQSFHLHGKNNKGHVDFIPNRDFETDKVIVDYPMPGADANGIVVALGQRLGLGLISREKARHLDPLVDDPELEHDRTLAEGIEQASLSSLQAMANEGAIPPADLARITELIVEDNLPLYKAVLQAQQEAEERQATPAPEAMSPEAMPGLALPGAGAEQPVIEDPGPNMFNLQKMLMGLRSPQTEGAGAAPPMVAG